MAKKQDPPKKQEPKKEPDPKPDEQPANEEEQQQKQQTKSQSKTKAGAQQGEVKKLYRSEKHSVIGGVCAGVAKYFALDVVVVRVVWAIAALIGGMGIVAYIAAWIIVPEDESESDGNDVETPKEPNNSGMIIGGILVAFGIILLIDELHFGFPPFFAFHHLDFGLIFSLLLLGLGIYVIVTRENEKSDLSNLLPKRTDDPDKPGLTRSILDRKIAGVCGGIAHYFNIDVSFVRIGFVIFFFAAGFFVPLIIYLILILLMPEENNTKKISD